MQATGRLRGFLPGVTARKQGNRSSDRLLYWLLVPVFVISILPIVSVAFEGVVVGWVTSLDYFRDVLG
ncbi:MAG: hypothetical protein RLN85_14240, partial [Pseudomonadales bacterium]